MLEDHAAGGLMPDSAGPRSVMEIADSGLGLLPAPDPGVADSARLRLAARRVLSGGQSAGQTPARPIDDIQAINVVIDAARSDAVRPADALDIGAGLVVLCDLRLYLDGLKAGLLDAAQQAGLGWDVIAAIIGVPADEARHRHRTLRARQSSQ